MSGGTIAVVCAPAPVIVRVLAPLRGSIVSTSPGSPIATWTRPVAGLKKVTSGAPAIGQLVGDLARRCVELDQGAVVARRVQPFARVIDIEPVGAAGRQRPVRDVAQVRQAGDQNHRRLADAQEHALGRRIGHAPARPPRQVDRRVAAVVEAVNLQRRTGVVVADAGDDAEILPFDDGRAVRPRAGLEHRLRLVGRRIEPGDTGRATIGQENFAVVGHGTGDAGKSRQSRDVLARIMVDHLDAVARGVGDEDAAGPRIERGMIEFAARGVAGSRSCLQFSAS